MPSSARSVTLSGRKMGSRFRLVPSWRASPRQRSSRSIPTTFPETPTRPLSLRDGSDSAPGVQAVHPLPQPEPPEKLLVVGHTARARRRSRSAFSPHHGERSCLPHPGPQEFPPYLRVSRREIISVIPRVRMLLPSGRCEGLPRPGWTEKVRIDGQDWHGRLLVVRLFLHDRECIVIVRPGAGDSRITPSSSRKW